MKILGNLSSNTGRSLLAIGIVLLIVTMACQTFIGFDQPEEQTQDAPQQAVTAVEQAEPTFTVSPEGDKPDTPLGEQIAPGLDSNILVELHDRLNPGVVNISVVVQRETRSGQGAGSGFILDNEGHIVTNNHVIDGAEEIVVIFYNGVQAEAQVVGTDADSDLAVLQVDTAEVPDGANFLDLGNSDEVDVGQWVIAIGNPFGIGSSMTQGIVSAVGRSIPSVTPYQIPSAIQTDAAINPGNSGGPLLNLAGEVIGVNAQIATGGGGGAQASAGVAFAIPSNIVRMVAPALIERGSFQWPWLGVEGVSVNLFIARANNLDTQRGAYVINVVPESPAAEAGLQGDPNQDGEGGDVIIEIEGETVRDFSDLLSYLALNTRPDETITLTIIRNGERMQVDLNLEPRPQNFQR